MPTSADLRGHGTRALTVEDNIQAIQHQGYPGVISKCTVCHTSTPGEHFEHKR